ncbi:MAG TPA: FHA domain-containing protein, partial [Kofleriaceae bacterium]
MGDYDEEETTGSTVSLRANDDAELCALVSVDGRVTTHVLPAAATVLDIGRGVDCDLVIEHPSVSRHHAKLQLLPLSLTDMGSRNGTKVRGEWTEAGVPLPISIGEAFQLGQATVLIHHKRLVT